jgi:hypothetical protein
MRTLTIPLSLALALALVGISTLGLVQLASARIDRNIGEKEFTFNLPAKAAANSGAVTFKVRNARYSLHDFKINGMKTRRTR